MPEFGDSHYLLFIAHHDDESWLDSDSSIDKRFSSLFREQVIPYYFQSNHREIEFYKGEHGKPGVKGEHRHWFNISHSHGVAVLLISRIGEVGIDIEYQNHDRPILKVANRFFHQQEVKGLKRLSLDEACRQARHLWVLKESYIKAIGKGLTQPLNSFWFDLGKIPVALYLGREIEPNYTWNFHLYKYQNKYDLSLCVPESGEIRTFSVRVQSSCFSVNEIEGETEFFHQVR